MQPRPYKNTDRVTDPVKWNKAWDERLKKLYQPRPEYPELDRFFRDPVPPGQRYLAAAEQSRKDLCILQHDLAKFAAEKRTDYNFDAMWIKMSSDARENYLLQGLVISCGAVSSMEDRRIWCPETTMKFLQRDDGRGFLDLLTTICPANDTSPQPRSKPILVSHPICDALLHIDGPRKAGENEAARAAFQNSAMIHRNFFITFFVWNTMLHIYGESETYMEARVANDKETFLTLSGLGMTKQDFIKARKEYKEDQKSAEWSCSNCLTLGSRLPEGKKLMECSKCQIVGRKVKYCNRECQMNDWKRGNPPHKTICGRPFTVPETVQTTKIQQAPNPSAEALESASAGPPPPDPGYTRSEALLHQISFLQKDHKVDYVFIEPYPKPDLGIEVKDPSASKAFEACRDQAMKNGDPQSVALMYTILKDRAMWLGISQDRLLLQLSKEYQLDIDTLTGLVQEAEKTMQDMVSTIVERLRMNM